METQDQFRVYLAQRSDCQTGYGDPGPLGDLSEGVLLLSIREGQLAPFWDAKAFWSY